MDKMEILKLSTLARVELKESEIEAFSAEIGTILNYVNQITEMDTSSSLRIINQKNVMREDENPHERGIYTKKILDQAPDKEGQYIRVKKILQ